LGLFLSAAIKNMDAALSDIRHFTTLARTPEPAAAPGEEAMQLAREVDAAGNDALDNVPESMTPQEVVERAMARVIQRIIDQRDAALAKGFRAGQVDMRERATSQCLNPIVAEAARFLPIKDMADAA
jgi:hypothetical protein